MQNQHHHSDDGGERLDDLEAPRYESTFPAERIPAAAGDGGGGGGDGDATTDFVPTPYLDIMSVASKIHAHSKEASSYHRLFVEPLAIPDISHTGITTTLIDAAEPQRITYPNGRRRTNLQDLLRAELRGAVYNSTDEFRDEDLEDKPTTAASVLGGATAFTTTGGGGGGSGRRKLRGRSTAPASTGGGDGGRRVRRPLSLAKSPSNRNKKGAGGKKTRGSGGGKSPAHLPGGGRRAGTMSTMRRPAPRTLERLTLPETSPFWRKAAKPQAKRQRDQQVQGLLRNLRSFGHAKDVRK